jgi:transitional endoplasmic reticulum ATPase
MMEAFEQRVILGWIANLGGRLERFRWAQEGLLRFLTDEAEHLELDVADDGRKLDAESWQSIVADRLDQLTSSEPSTLELNLRAVSELLQLNAGEAAVMSALVRERVVAQAEDLFETLELDELRVGDSGVVSLLAAMLAVTRGEVLEALSARGRLMSSGLFTTIVRTASRWPR